MQFILHIIKLFSHKIHPDLNSLLFLKQKTEQSQNYDIELHSHNNSNAKNYILLNLSQE
jgi:hypothetical protein